MPKIGAKSLVGSLRNVSKPQAHARPVWKGPEVDGITQSLLGKFLGCRERFRLSVIEGLKPRERFNHRLEYGNLWHVCEEHFAASGNPITNLANAPWKRAVTKYAQSLVAKYRLDQQQVEHWYQICIRQFPLYIDYYKKRKDVLQRTPILQEGMFNYNYVLPSGRTVKLRGKFDSVDLIGPKSKQRIFLQENKAKGEIDEQLIHRQLNFDLQTMIYLTVLSLSKAQYGLEKFPLGGVRYNVIRRPLSGGKGTIRQHQPTKSNPQGESAEDFYNRLAQYISDDPKYYFMRWTVDVTKTDLLNFKTQFLDPVLQQLCDWWDWVSTLPENPFENPIHFRFPFGVYNPLVEDRSSELDNYLMTGNETGLYHTANLFPELT